MGKTIKNNILNDLDTQSWVARLHSIQEYEWHIPPELKAHLKMGTLTPPPLAADIIRFFTKKHAEVFDPFAGEGGILVGAAMAERLASGCDLYMENKETAAKVGTHYGFPPANGWGMMGDVDAIDWLRWLVEERGRAETQDLLFTDPPWGVDHGRTHDKGGSVPFNMVKLGGEDKLDIGTFESWEEFYKYLQTVAHYSYQLLKPGSYALWQLGDRNRGGHYRMVPAEAVPYIEAEGFVLKGAQHFVQKPLNVRRPVFGWGKAFVELIYHWTLLIFRKGPRR